MSVREVALRMCTIYLDAEEFGSGYAVVEWVVEVGLSARPARILAENLSTLQQARESLPPYADACFHRSDEDAASIVETWT